MTAGDPIRAAQQVKRTATLLRDARAVLRKLDVLAAAARAADDPAHADIAALRDGCERLVSQLGHREQTLQRRARRRRPPAPLTSRAPRGRNHGGRSLARGGRVSDDLSGRAARTMSPPS